MVAMGKELGMFAETVSSKKRLLARGRGAAKDRPGAGNHHAEPNGRRELIEHEPMRDSDAEARERSVKANVWIAIEEGTSAPASKSWPR